MMSLFRAVTAKHGLGGGGLVGLKRGAGGGVTVRGSVCVSLEKASHWESWAGEQSRGRVFEIFLARFNFPCFSKLKKILSLYLLLKMLLLFQRQPFLSHFPFGAFLGN